MNGGLFRVVTRVPGFRNPFVDWIASDSLDAALERVKGLGLTLGLPEESTFEVCEVDPVTLTMITDRQWLDPEDLKDE